jgi:HEAT repeat protein
MLYATLEDSNSYVLIAAAGALVQMGDAHAVVRLCDKLKDNNWEVRSTAEKTLVETLVKIGGAAVESLCTALCAALSIASKDRNWDTRRAVAEALITLYKNSSIDARHKKIIIAHKNIIEYHYDVAGGGCMPHDDYIIKLPD